MQCTTLVIISPLRGFQLPNGNIILTKKFIDGLKLYRKLWDGPVLHICEPAAEPSHNLDNTEIPFKIPEFDTICEKLTEDNLRSALPKKSIVVSSVGKEFNFVSKICRKLGVPCIYISEYSLQTRLQIVAEYQASWLRGAWQKIRQIQQELAQRRAISIADGIQCNGIPTYRSYQRINQDPHLFFDVRTEASTPESVAQIMQKYVNFYQGRKLRLAFSGRLSRMKGVDDLLTVAF